MTSIPVDTGRWWTEEGMLPLTELGHGRQGQIKWRGSEMGKQPHIGMWSEKSVTSMQNARHLLRGTSTSHGGMALCPLEQLNK